jgi:uncharacterized membrane protein YkoI
MNKKLTFWSVLLCCGLIPSVQAASTSYKGSEYASEAKLTIDQAGAIALKAYPGTITEVELEHKRGGSGLRYSFDIRAHHMTHEVAVDAKTGDVVENVREPENDKD